MPIVFVHGVNTRKGASYEAGIRATQKFISKHLASAHIGGKPLQNLTVAFPYWGDLATRFAWDMDSLPSGEMQALGGTANIDLQPLLAHLRDAFPNLPKQDPLTALAKKYLPLAVDVVTDLALQNAAKGEEDDIAEFVVRASAYAEANPSPAWLTQINNDQQFLAILQANIVEQAPDVQALGGLKTAFGKIAQKLSMAGLKLKQAVKSAAGRAVDKAGDFASTKLLAASRGSLNATLGRFFGDVFIYLEGRGAAGSPGAIGALILKAFDDARAATPQEPFVIIAHSLGGVISFDLLSHFRPDVQVDLFVSVGSQIAHFEELKLYKASNQAIVKPQRAATPPNIGRWINIYDEVDIFSYSVQRVFDRVDVDGRYDTQTYTIKAHGAYFEQDRFYQRLRARIDQLP